MDDLEQVYNELIMEHSMNSCNKKNRFKQEARTGRNAG